MTALEIWAATTTPFDADRELDPSVVPDQGKRLVDLGVHGAFVAGTTGEFPALSIGERMRLLETWAAERPPGLRLGVHVGHTNLAESRRLAAHAAGCGVDLIASVTPYFGTPNSIATATAFLTEVAAAAPETPFCYYHFPSMTGSPFRPSDLVAAMLDRIPTFSGVKFTDTDLLEFDRTRAVSPGIRVYFGKDELLPAALAFGADAVIGSLYNALAPQAHQIAAAIRAGRVDDALVLHGPFRDVAAAAAEFGGVGFVKEWLNRIGPDAGPARTPWGPLPPAAHETINRLTAGWRPTVCSEVAEEAEVFSATRERTGKDLP